MANLPILHSESHSSPLPDKLDTLEQFLSVDHMLCLLTEDPGFSGFL